MRLTTPKDITPLIRSFCARLVPDAVPFFVQVRPSPFAKPGESFANVANAVARFGGGSFGGWAISECADFLLGEFCTVWFTVGGGTIDLTPKLHGEQNTLFLPDTERTYDGYHVTDRIQPKNSRGYVAAMNRLFSSESVVIVGMPGNRARSKLFAWLSFFCE